MEELTLYLNDKIILKATKRGYTIKERIDIPYKLNEFVPDSKREEWLTFWIAKPLFGKEIYIGHEKLSDVKALFLACNVKINDIDKYYSIDKIIRKINASKLL
jgi:hypothetical protein